MPGVVFSAFLLFTCITAITPGLNNILALGAAGRRGLRDSGPLLSGIFSGLFCVMLLCGAVSFSVSRLSDGFMVAMRWVGCAYIVWMSWKVISAPVGAAGGKEGDIGFWGGFALQFANAKIIISGLATFSGFILPYYDSSAPIFGFALLIGLFGNLGTMCWALAGSVLRQFLLRHGRAANIVMGLMLLICAAGLL